ncbi:MAG: putative collagen-binding domain-containing protein, partial [Bacteroidota bacterium]
FPNQPIKVYTPHLGEASALTGLSLQNSWNDTHKRSLYWIQKSAETSRPWVVANDEQGSAGHGTPPDPGYPGFDEQDIDYSLHDIRKQTLWGNLMAGGAGVEYYFGYKLPENDLLCEDFRSREQSWGYAAHAIRFFAESGLAFHEMANQNALIGNPDNDKQAYCLAKANESYLVYLGYTAEVMLDLSEASGTFELQWFNPRTGETLAKTKRIKGGKSVRLRPPTERGEDWLAVIKKAT